MNCVKCKKAIPEDAIFCPYCGKKQQSEKKKKKKRATGTGSVIRKPGNRSKPWRRNQGYTSALTQQNTRRSKPFCGWQTCPRQKR